MNRTFSRSRFRDAYQAVVLSTQFAETDSYYHVYRSRYERTLRRLAALPLQPGARIVEIGGGQIAMLSRTLFADETTVWDLNPAYSEPLRQAGIRFAQYDLIHDSAPPETDTFDAMVLCEVVEHMPVPLFTVLERATTALQRGGYLLVTTPNVFRLRNAVRLVSGQDLFCNWDLPERGRGLGHVTEFSAARLRWQAERAGLRVCSLEHVQLTFRGSTVRASIGKAIALPLSIVPLWRDGLIMICQRA